MGNPISVRVRNLLEGAKLIGARAAVGICSVFTSLIKAIYRQRIKISILLVLVVILYFFSLRLGLTDFFDVFLANIKKRLAGQSIALFFSRCLGWEGGILVAGILYFLGGSDTGGVQMVAPSGTSGPSSSEDSQAPGREVDLELRLGPSLPSPDGDSGAGASTSCSEQDWKKALDLPDQMKAPDSLRRHVEKELVILFNIGKKKALHEATINGYIQKLRLDVETVGFHRELLSKIDSLQTEHWNNGNPIPFNFSTKAEKDRIYSIMWNKPL